MQSCIYHKNYLKILFFFYFLKNKFYLYKRLKKMYMDKKIASKIKHTLDNF
jgi:hypothetical protein